MFVRMYTGDDGKTHFEEIELPLGETKGFPLKVGSEISIRRGDHVDLGDWHNAERRQFVISLEGGFQVLGSGDGVLREFHAGDILLAEDLTGEGHRSGSRGISISVVVPIEE